MQRKSGERLGTSIRTPMDILPLPTDITTPNLQRISLRDISQRMICVRTLNPQQLRERQLYRLSREKVAEISFNVEENLRAVRRLGQQWKRSHRAGRLGQLIQGMSAVDIFDRIYMRYDTLVQSKRASTSHFPAILFADPHGHMCRS